MNKIKIASAIACSLFVVNAALASDNDDKRIEKSAEKSYTFKHQLKDDEVKVDAVNGIVTLSGTVDVDSHKYLAQETVLGLPGVSKVINDIKLKGEEPAENSDGWIFTKVKSALLFSRNVSSMTDVAVKDGIVTLNGEADSEAEKELTKEYVMDVEGVKNVINEMKVTSVPRKKAKSEDMMDDASITARVKYSLLSHRSTSASKTHVETKNGSVTLTGTAKNMAEKDLVSKLVGDLRGVKKVNNKMVF